MYISKLKAKNYKSFLDSKEINFKQGINIIIGQNNSGKTALLEMIELKFQDKPHKSELTGFFDDTQIRQDSRVEISLVASPEELKLFVENPKLSEIIIPYPSDNNVDNAVSKFNQCFESGLDVKLQISKVGIWNRVGLNFLYPEMNRNLTGSSLRIQKQGDSFKATERINEVIKTDEIFWWKIIDSNLNNIYRFDAERPNLGRCIVGLDRTLKPNGSNLAEVLSNTDANNDDLYEEFNKYVLEVFPSVKGIKSVRIEPPQNSEILGTWNEVIIWTVDRKTRREDLAFPLSECGTGIGQVLAILYVIVTSNQPRTIIIDEPNSFLHPGAAKKLIQILNKFPQHQYFVSTHSPEILSAAKPSTITRLKYVEGETIAESINLEQTKDLRETLDEIGVKFSDVFFSENILWVEGETEQKAFPLILETSDKLFDVTILPLVHTDDLRERKSKGRKHAKLVFEIYERLSGANALTPPFVAVILDKESSSLEEIKKLSETFGDKLKFIPRMMYENYLIDAEAITKTLNDEIIEDKDKVNVQQVREWITEKRETKFFSKSVNGKKILKEEMWLEDIHAADLLNKLFLELSNKTVEYRKTTHSVKLTQWILENKPELLSELRSFLVSILEKQ